jgi:hypothetical protein
MWFMPLATLSNLFAGDPAILRNIPSRSRNLTNTSSASTFRFATKCLNECIKLHCCGLFAENDPHREFDLTIALKPIRKMALPARLIQLDAFDRDGKLVDVDTATFPNGCPLYAALSYCWGENRPEHAHRTDNSNLGQRMLQIDYDKLPKTLQEAFAIARRLGVGYLWIDALCIVQDSDLDWHAESAKMGHIYEAAAFTIAADGGHDNESGCFNQESVPQDVSGDDGIVIVRNMLDGKPSLLKFWIKPWMFYSPQGHQEPEIINQSQTSRRGWCCQERMLSKRILHYTETQLFFECQRHYRAEDGFVTWNPGQDTVAGLLPQIPGPMFDVNGGGHASASELKWYNSIIQNDFSKREVRHPREKLIALSGIASMLSTKMERVYLAGMWYDKALKWALSWERASHVPADSLEGAPSFSWASVNVSVRWPSRLVDFKACSHFNLEKYKIRPVGRNKFGTVSKCYIKITGLVKEAFVQRPSGLRERTGVFRERSGSFDSPCRGFLRSLDRTPVGSAVIDHLQAGQYDRVSCLLLGESDPLESWGSWHVLLLKPKPDSKDGYIRVGVGEIQKEGTSACNDGDFPDWFTDAISKNIYIH